MLNVILTALLAPVGNKIAKLVHALVRGVPPIMYSREIRTRRWIARLEGYKAIGDTRTQAAERVIWLAKHGLLPNDF